MKIKVLLNFGLNGLKKKEKMKNQTFIIKFEILYFSKLHLRIL
jgi:hypothetical protein